MNDRWDDEWHMMRRLHLSKLERLYEEREALEARLKIVKELYICEKHGIKGDYDK